MQNNVSYLQCNDTNWALVDMPIDRQFTNNTLICIKPLICRKNTDFLTFLPPFKTDNIASDLL